MAAANNTASKKTKTSELLLIKYIKITNLLRLTSAIYSWLKLIHFHFLDNFLQLYLP